MVSQQVNYVITLKHNIKLVPPSEFQKQSSTSHRTECQQVESPKVQNPKKLSSSTHLRATEVTHCTTHQKCQSFHRRYGSRCSATAAQLLACSPYPRADAERGRCYWPQRGNHPAKRLIGGSQQIHQRVSILVVGIWKYIPRSYYI